MTLLQDAADAALEGRVHNARSLGILALHHAIVSRDHLQELAARLQLSELLLSLGVGAEAAMHARTAVEALRPDTPAPLRIKSLVNWSYAASFIGDGSNSLRCSSEARDHADAIGDPELRALTHNYFGVANMWDGRWDTANSAFAMSRSLVPGNSRPFLNAAINELLRTTVNVTLEGARLTQRHGLRAESTITDALSRPLSRALGVVAASGEAAVAFIRCIVASWRQDAVAATEALETARSHLASGGDSIRWMKPYLPWAECELAFMLKRYGDAADAATKIIHEADLQGSEQAHWVGCLLRARCLHVMGAHGRASHDWRYLWVRSMRRHSSAGAPPVLLDAAPAEEANSFDWARDFGLTVAEASVVQFLLDGHRLSDIAVLRSASIGTVRSQLASIFSKTGFKSQGQLVAGVLARQRQ